MFANMRIARYDEQGTIQRYVGVPIKFGPKEKAFYWLKEKRKTEEVLPMLAVEVVSVDFAGDRMANMKEKIIVTEDSSNHIVKRVYNAVPYNFGINLNIWTLFMVDLDQILEQILPYFSPHAFVKINVPELGVDMEIKVVLQSSNPDETSEYGEEDWRVIRWSINFMVHGYVFKKMEDDEKTIIKIIDNIYTSETDFNERSTTSTFSSAAASGADEVMYLEGLAKDPNTGVITYKFEIFD